MSDREKFHLPSEFHRREFPITRLRPLADSRIITPAEDERGFLLDHEVTQLLGGVVLGNTAFRTDQYDRRRFRWFWRPPIATGLELERSRADRQRFAEPALFGDDGPYPGPIVMIKRDANGEAIRPIERIAPRSREIKPIPPAETLMTRNAQGEVVWKEDSYLEEEEDNPAAEYLGKPEMHVIKADGMILALHGLHRKIKKRRATKEWIEPRAIRAHGRRGDISLYMDLPVNSDLSLDETRPRSAVFRQSGFSTSFHEIYGGDESTVQITARAVARGLLKGSMRIHVPQLFVPASWTEVEPAELPAEAHSVALPEPR